MKEAHPILVLIPIAFGSATVVLTIFIHALPLSATVRLIRRQEKLGRLGIDFRKDMVVVIRTILYAFVAHLIEIALWATVFVICGEFTDFATAFYHSAVNYTALGGDILMSPTWRVLGPVETANGMLLFSLSTAMVFALIQRLVEARYTEFKDRTH